MVCWCTPRSGSNDGARLETEGEGGLLKDKQGRWLVGVLLGLEARTTVDYSRGDGWKGVVFCHKSQYSFEMLLNLEPRLAVAWRRKERVAVRTCKPSQGSSCPVFWRTPSRVYRRPKRGRALGLSAVAAVNNLGENLRPLSPSQHNALQHASQHQVDRTTIHSALLTAME